MGSAATLRDRTGLLPPGWLEVSNKSYYDSSDLTESGKWRDIARSTSALRVVKSVLREIRLEYFPRHDGPLDWVDVGCGLGGTYQVAQELGWRYVGVDCAEKHIAYCRRQYPQGKFVLGDWLQHCGEYDLVSFISSLHHFDDWRAAIDKAFALVRPGGVVLVDHEPMRLYSKLFRLYCRYARRADPSVIGRVEVHWFGKPSILPSELPEGQVWYHFDFFPLLGRLRLRTRSRILGAFFEAYRKVMWKRP